MRHWVFDLDGTLIDSFDYYLNFARRVFAQNAVNFSEAHQSECLGSAALPFLEKYLGSAVATMSLAELRAQSLIDAEMIRPFSGVEELLSTLKERGSRIGVWTNRDKGTTERVLTCTGLDRFVDITVTGCCVPRHKPHPDGMQRILGSFECNADEVTMVGDHDVDMVAALKSGVRPLRASWHRHRPSSTCPLGADVVHTVDGLRNWFSKS